MLYQMNMDDVHAYLRLPPRMSALEVMRDAVQNMDAGAMAILNAGLELRLNRRSRRSFDAVLVEYAKSAPARWFNVLRDHLFSLYRLYLGKSFISSTFKIKFKHSI